VNITAAALPASPIVITVPGAAAPATYNASLRVINSTTGCFSDTPITITVNPNPTITLVDASLEVCAGETSVNLATRRLRNSPNQYSLLFDASALAQGFVNITAAALPASPIVITVPGAAAPATYNAFFV
jgi:large repetitive protein